MLSCAWDKIQISMSLGLLNCTIHLQVKHKWRVSEWEKKWNVKYIQPPSVHKTILTLCSLWVHLDWHLECMHNECGATWHQNFYLLQKKTMRKRNGKHNRKNTFRIETVFQRRELQKMMKQQLIEWKRSARTHIITTKLNFWKSLRKNRRHKNNAITAKPLVK